MTENELTEKVIKESKIIAVVGLSPKEHRTSHIIAKYMQGEGYRVIPVYPNVETVLGEKAYKCISDISEPIDCVLVFRRSEFIMDVAKEALKIKPKFFWTQQGIEDFKAKELLEAEGISVIMNKCIYVEHQRLFA